MMSLTKDLQPPTKKFSSSADLKTPDAFEHLTQLSSAIGRGAMALVRQPKTAGFWLKSRFDIVIDQPPMC